MINPNSKDYITNATKEDFWECYKKGFSNSRENVLSQYENQIRNDFEAWFENHMRVKLSPMVQC